MSHESIAPQYTIRYRAVGRDFDTVEQAEAFAMGYLTGREDDGAVIISRVMVRQDGTIRGTTGIHMVRASGRPYV